MGEIGKIAWKSPSNIAFIKYWGKYGNQMPLNPSLSMTLSECHTITSIQIETKVNIHRSIDFAFLFEGEEKPDFADRIGTYLASLEREFPYLNNFRFIIESSNSFPHSSGIASSASAMSALALCLVSIDQQLGNTQYTSEEFYSKASAISRLGSGSASRSVYGEFVSWGQIGGYTYSSNKWASPVTANIHPMYDTLHDTVLIISPEAKNVSSSAGHLLMQTHPYAESRVQSAKKNLIDLMQVMQTDNFNRFADILEHEAMSLHSMMLTSKPWYTLLTPNTLIAIQLVRHFRESTGTKLCFTLDAGPNIHLIYPDEEHETVKEFIDSELKTFCTDGSYIEDEIGTGPELLIDEFEQK